mgnify:CR=1 FL=1
MCVDELYIDIFDTISDLKNKDVTNMNNNKLREIWDRRAAIHASMKEHRKSDKFEELYNKSWWYYIEPLLPKIEGSKILEAGCGTGRWVDYLAPMGYQMVLSDLSPEMIRHAREHVEELGLSERVSYEVLDICDMNTLPTNNFDLVLSAGEPLTQCSNPNIAVSEFYRVTKTGGYVICDASNRYRAAFDLVQKNDLSQFMKVLEIGELLYPNGLVKHLLGPKELADLFEAKGMKVLCIAGITPFYSFPPNKKLISSLKDDYVFDAMMQISERYAEHPSIVNLSARLLVVAQKLK